MPGLCFLQVSKNCSSTEEKEKNVATKENFKLQK
jgi:hypothetical protein